jgi:uncharacterized repeat protein (TIGR02543 family)
MFKDLRRVVAVVMSVVVFAAALAVVPLSYSPSASAVTSGIVAADLALNLDPNLAASYAGSGATVTDLSGAGRNGTLTGTPLPTFSNTSPKSFLFQKEPIYSTSSPANKISVGGTFLKDDFTIQTWIKTDEVGYSTAHYTTMFIMAAECGGGAPDWGLGVDDTGKLAFGAGWSDQTFATSESVNSNNWINVAASREMSTGQIKLYIDGALKVTALGQSGNSLTCSADGNTWIGNGQDGPAYSFGGRISSVLAYTDVLTSAEVLTNYNATVNTFYPVTYTMTYNANGATSGSAPSDGSFTSGSSASTVAGNSGSLARSGYIFAGWNTTANGTGTTYAAGTDSYSTNSNVTLYAVWTPNPTTTTTTTTTTLAPVVVIDIQVPSPTALTVPQGQASIATIAPSASVAVSATSTTIPKANTASTAVVPTTMAPQLAKPTNSIPPPVIPKVSMGESALDVGGVSTKVEMTRVNNQLVIQSGSMKAVLSGLDDKGATRALDSDGNLRLAGGDVVKINVGGFKPGSDVDVWLFSTPKHLGTSVVGANGQVSGSFTIPADVESGSHRIAVTAKLPNGKSATFTLGIAVGDIARSSTLTRILIAIPIALAVLAGFLLPNQMRRRRRLGVA